jgi:hypothetical protein
MGRRREHRQKRIAIIFDIYRNAPEGAFFVLTLSQYAMNNIAFCPALRLARFPAPFLIYLPQKAKMIW